MAIGVALDHQAEYDFGIEVSAKKTKIGPIGLAIELNPVI
jgi:hypothetical protein